MNETLRAEVRARAADRCEYCRLPQSATIVTHEADHIRPQKHNGPTTLENLCWACGWCNAFKGSDVAGFDPLNDALTPLFNPRTQNWNDHFIWRGPVLDGLTPAGRTTIAVLKINEVSRVEHRRLLTQLGDHPSD
jgi:hypothetical protein